MEEIGELYDANERWKNELLEHMERWKNELKRYFDCTAENLTRDFRDAHKEDIAGVTTRVRRLEEHTGLAR